MEEAKKIDKSQLEEFKFSLSREAYSKNGVPFVTSSEGETYRSIADRYGLFLKELLKYNDLDAAQELLPGTVVYLQAKKNQSQKGLDKFIVDEDGLTSREAVFAGGDAVTGAATVISAMGAGKLAAASIDKYLSGK